MILDGDLNVKTWYVIASCECPKDCSTDFWMWDTKYDIGYELNVYDELIPYADKCSTLEEAESQAKDVLSSIWDDEVYIVLVYEDKDGDIDYTEFIKLVSRTKD